MEFTEKLVDNSERKTKIGFFIFLSLIDGYGPWSKSYIFKFVLCLA